MSAVLQCPRCGSDRVGSADVVTATAHGAWVLEEGGERRFEPGGWTDVHWYSQREEDPAMPCYCPSCDWQGAPADMKTPPTS